MAEGKTAVMQRASAPAIPLTQRLPQTKGWKELVRDIWDDNPTFRMILAMCPTMGATNMAINGMAQGLATLIATVASSATVAALRTIIPAEVRLPSYMIIIAFWVTIVDIFLRAYLPPLSAALGPYVPLIITNCFVLGRAEAFASQNGPGLSALDALGVGLGFTMSLTLLGIVRELLGFGSLFGIQIFSGWTPWVIMIIPAGAFLLVGIYVGIVKHFSPGGQIGGGA
jgi:electron transport complex protein RnfE